MGKSTPAGWGLGAVPLARRNMFVDRSRLLRSASGIAFAVFLMLVQLGFRAAFTDSTLEVIRSFDADIVITSAVKYQLSKKATFSRRHLYEAKAVPGVASAHPVYAEWTRSNWQNQKDGQRSFIQVFGFDPDQPAFLLPEVNARLAELREPDTVMMDTRSRPFLGEARTGLESELARRRVRVIGTFTLGPDFFTDGTLITSDRNFDKLFSSGAARTASGSDRISERPDIEFGFVKIQPGHDVKAVQKSLRTTLPATVKVMTRQELIEQEQNYQALFSGVGPIFGMGVAIGFAVGMMIAYQILYNDIFDQLPQYATLKAMGYGNGYLVKVVLQQAMFYGIVGYVPAFLMCSVLFKILGDIVLLPMRMTPGLVAVSLALTLGMCIISGLIAVRRVIQTDPAEVF